MLCLSPFNIDKSVPSVLSTKNPTSMSQHTFSGRNVVNNLGEDRPKVKVLLSQRKRSQWSVYALKLFSDSQPLSELSASSSVISKSTGQAMCDQARTEESDITESDGEQTTSSIIASDDSLFDCFCDAKDNTVCDGEVRKEYSEYVGRSKSKSICPSQRVS